MVKKSLKRKKAKRIKLKENFNIKKIKKLIKQELYTNYTENGKKKEENIFESLYLISSKEEKENDYNKRYSKYIAEQFNSTLVNMLITYINNNSSFPRDFQLESNFIYNLINLIKHIFIKEIELVNFTLLIDKMGWKHQKIDHWTYFLILGIYAKILVGNEEESNKLIDFFQIKNNKFLEYYKMIVDEDIPKKVDKNEITIKIINKRFKQITKPINSYCKQNYINYNAIVDEIANMSQPYGEESNGAQLYNNEYLKLKINKKNDLAFNLQRDFKNTEFFPNYQNNNPNYNNNNNINSQNFQANILKIDNEFCQNDIYSINNNKNKYNNIEYNNNQSCYLPSFNFVNKPSLQYSLNFENNYSNNDLFYLKVKSHLVWFQKAIFSHIV